MPDNESLIQKAFSAYLDSHPEERPLDQIVRLLASGRESRREITEALQGNEDLFREDLLDLMIFFIESCIRDHRLDDEEKRAIRQLKRLLGIREGRLFGLRRDEVTRLIREEMELVLADRRVEREEALYQVALQDVFDLSYDQYLAVTRDAVRRILDDAVCAAKAGGGVTPAARRRLVDQLRALETFCPLSAEERQIVLGED